MSAVQLVGATPDPLPMHTKFRVAWMLFALNREGHIIQDHWDELTPEAKTDTLKQVKRLSHDLYLLTLGLTKGGDQ